MRSTCFGAMILTICLALYTTSEGNAQIPVSGAGGTVPTRRPTFSPYLNLLRSGNSPTLNYFGLVRPELNAISAINNLQQQEFSNQQSINDLQQTPNQLPTTGFTAKFLNTGGYFSGGGAGVGVGTTGPTSSGPRAPR